MGGGMFGYQKHGIRVRNELLASIQPREDFRQSDFRDNISK